MKTLLNLLPEEKKELVQSKLRFRFLLWQAFLFFLLELFYFSILIGMLLILDFQHKSLQEALGQGSEVAELAQEKKLSLFEEKFQSTNELTDRVARIEYSHLHFTSLFTLLDTLVPAGVTLQNLSTKDYTVSLIGQAAERDNLIRFDENLKNSECISDVNVPLSNLFSQQDIAFQIDFNILPECLKK